MTGYQIFTMIELARIANIIPIDLEYDTTWEQGTALHNEFWASEFNNPKEPEYECIEAFLANKAKTMELETKNHLDSRLRAARKILTDNGYYTDNLWSVEDVMGKFNCTFEEAMEVLDDAMGNDATYEQIWMAIDCAADANGLEEIDSDDDDDDDEEKDENED
jgi:hypothetical protein